VVGTTFRRLGQRRSGDECVEGRLQVRAVAHRLAGRLPMPTSVGALEHPRRRTSLKALRARFADVGRTLTRRCAVFDARA
jgi:hypothetical protein